MFLKFITPLLLISLMYSEMSSATDFMIFEVRKSLPMENNEVAYKDYYINSGNESGLKKGMYIGVVRNSAIQDPAKNSTQGTLKIPIAKMQIIQVEKKLSVGRLYNQTSNDERATVEFEGVMVGDVLDMESASMEAPITKAKRKTAAVEDDAEVVLIKSKVVETPKVVPAPQVTAPVEPSVQKTSTPEMVKQPVPAQAAPQTPGKVSTQNKPAENIL